MVKKEQTERERNALWEVERAEQAAVLAQQRLEKALTRLNNTANEPDQPKRGSVIKFQVQFQETGTVYSYAALRAPNNGWYITGKADPMRWDELLDYMYRDVTTKRLGVGFQVWDGKGTRWVGRKP